MTKEQTEFVEAVADFVTADAAHFSILLQMQKPTGQRWARAYQASGCRGWAGKEEAAQAITALLFPKGGK